MQHYLHTVTSTVHSCLTLQFPFAHITHPRILKQEAFENLETLNLSVNAILVSPFHLSGMLSASLQTSLTEFKNQAKDSFSGTPASSQT